MDTLRAKICHAILHVRQSEALSAAERQASTDQAKSEKKLLVAGLKPLMTKVVRLKSSLAATKLASQKDLSKLQQKAATAVSWVASRAEQMSSNFRSQARSNRALLQEALDDKSSVERALMLERDAHNLAAAKLGLLQQVASHAQQIACVTETAAMSHVQALNTALQTKQFRIDSLVHSLRTMRSAGAASPRVGCQPTPISSPAQTEITQGSTLSEIAVT
jgi:hypothetical protein